MTPGQPYPMLLLVKRILLLALGAAALLLTLRSEAATPSFAGWPETWVAAYQRF